LAELDPGRFEAVTASEMRELDRRAIEEFGVPGVVLMENAGRGAAEAALRMLEDADRERPTVLVCGKGNNGGDAYVVARHLHGHGRPVEVFLTHEPEAIRGEARTNLEILLKTQGIPVRSLSDEDEYGRLVDLLGCTPLIVDGLLGTGLVRTVAAPFDRIIGLVNDPGRPVLSLDVPSGLDSDTGQILGVSVQATTTVTFALPKRGLLVGKGPQVAGKLILVEIGMPRDLLAPYTRGAD